MYMESSSPRKPGDVAILESQEFPGGTVYCMSFWYHMYGDGIGTLAVSTTDIMNNSLALWSSTGNQGNAWKQGFVTIGDQQKVDYAVRFTGSISKTVSSDISLDDIQTTAGACSPNATQPMTGKYRSVYNHSNCVYAIFLKVMLLLYFSVCMQD